MLLGSTICKYLNCPVKNNYFKDLKFTQKSKRENDITFFTLRTRTHTNRFFLSR